MHISEHAPLIFLSYFLFSINWKTSFFTWQTCMYLCVFYCLNSSWVLLSSFWLCVFTLLATINVYFLSSFHCQFLFFSSCLWRLPRTYQPPHMFTVQTLLFIQVLPQRMFKQPQRPPQFLQLHIIKPWLFPSSSISITALLHWPLPQFTATNS